MPLFSEKLYIKDQFRALLYFQNLGASDEVGTHREFNLVKYVLIQFSCRVKKRQQFNVIITFHQFYSTDISHVFLHVRADYLIQPEDDKSCVQCIVCTHAEKTNEKVLPVYFAPPHISITQIN